MLSNWSSTSTIRNSYSPANKIHTKIPFVCFRSPTNCGICTVARIQNSWALHSLYFIFVYVCALRKCLRGVFLIYLRIDKHWTWLFRGDNCVYKWWATVNYPYKSTLTERSNDQKKQVESIAISALRWVSGVIHQQAQKQWYSLKFYCTDRTHLNAIVGLTMTMELKRDVQALQVTSSYERQLKEVLLKECDKMINASRNVSNQLGKSQKK